MSSKANTTKRTEPLNQKLDGYLRSARGVLALSGGQAKKLAGFTAATGAALAMAPATDADIVYSGIQNRTLTNLQIPGFTTNVGIDMDGSGNDFVMSLYGNYQTGTIGATYYGYPTYGVISQSINARLDGVPGVGLSVSGGGDARLLNSGDIISSLMTSSQSAVIAATANPPGLTQGNFLGATGFVAVQLASGNFGWIQIRTNNLPTGGDYVAIDWAYEDDMGAPIAAGATVTIPEPSTFGGLALIALGYAGVSRYRRRSKEAAGQTDV